MSVSRWRSDSDALTLAFCCLCEATIQNHLFQGSCLYLFILDTSKTESCPWPCRKKLTGSLPESSLESWFQSWLCIVGYLRIPLRGRTTELADGLGSSYEPCCSFHVKAKIRTKMLVSPSASELITCGSTEGVLCGKRGQARWQQSSMSLSPQQACPCLSFHQEPTQGRLCFGLSHAGVGLHVSRFFPPSFKAFNFVFG